MSNPVLAEVFRGQWLESQHRGAAIIVDADGAIVWSTGDIERPVFARSAVKLLQALPLIESGAADAWALSDTELALACASHSGEPTHVKAVTAWLARLGMDQTCLACGEQIPTDPEAARALFAEGAAPSRLHHNCSGKHTGFLTLARHLGVSAHGYERANHPVQRYALNTLADMAGVNLSSLPLAIDGCTAPAPALPLRAIAVAMAKVADPSGLDEVRGKAARRLDLAVRTHPFMVAGTGRACTTLMISADGGASVKMGAEGVYVAALNRLGLGIALKIDDGAGRAAEVVMAALLQTLGAVSTLTSAAQALLDGVLLNSRGEAVGVCRAEPTVIKSLADVV
jgi:L-asparaginase II